jgi:hypothetical protein
MRRVGKGRDMDRRRPRRQSRASNERDLFQLPALAGEAPAVQRPAIDGLGLTP